MADGECHYIGEGCCAMNLFEMLNVDFKHIDDRGELVQLAHQGYVQINVVKTGAGRCRGEHYHKTVKEAFYIVSGSAEAELRLIDNSESCKKRFCVGDFFMIPPLVVHSFFFSEECVMLAMYDKHVVDNRGVKDIYSVGG